MGRHNQEIYRTPNNLATEESAHRVNRAMEREKELRDKGLHALADATQHAISNDRFTVVDREEKEADEDIKEIVKKSLDSIAVALAQDRENFKPVTLDLRTHAEWLRSVPRTVGQRQLDEVRQKAIEEIYGSLGAEVPDLDAGKTVFEGHLDSRSNVDGEIWRSFDLRVAGPGSEVKILSALAPTALEGLDLERIRVDKLGDRVVQTGYLYRLTPRHKTASFGGDASSFPFW